MSSRARRKQRKLPFEVLPPAVSFSLLIVRKVSLAFDESWMSFKWQTNVKAGKQVTYPIPISMRHKEVPAAVEREKKAVFSGAGDVEGKQ